MLMMPPSTFSRLSIEDQLKEAAECRTSDLSRIFFIWAEQTPYYLVSQKPHSYIYKFDMTFQITVILLKCHSTVSLHHL